MTGPLRPPDAGSATIGAALAVAVVVVLLVLGLEAAVVLTAATGTSTTTTAESSQDGPRPLRADAPIPAADRPWVLRAGALCPDIGAVQLAAQLDLESSWRPDAYADVGEAPARGIAQFTDATWARWGGDANGNGTSSPLEAPDAILAQARLMCDLVTWAHHGLAAKTLHGNVLDLAWAAYFCGRACIQRAGGVPPAGLAHDYPQQVRARLPKYAATASTAVAARWVLPIHGYTLSSGFGQRWGVLHAGQDFAAPTGTPIVAVAAGIVTEADCTSPTCDHPGGLSMSGCGWTVRVDHGGGISTRYCHAERLAVRVGARVTAGQLLAWVGSTGNSTGPHLHFEVRHRNVPVDPLPLLRTAGLHP